MNNPNNVITEGTATISILIPNIVPAVCVILGTYPTIVNPTPINHPDKADAVLTNNVWNEATILSFLEPNLTSP